MSKLFVSQLKPMAGYVLVEPSKQETKTKSGIILTTKEEEKPQYGKALAVGGAIYDDGQEIVCPVKVSDKVVYKKWGGNEIIIDDIEYQLLKFEDILAIIK